jgi:hypothetical protein
MRVEDDEIRGRGRPAEARIGRMELFGIITLSVLVGSLLHDGVSVLIANAWTNYQLQQLQKELHTELGKIDREINRSWITAENATLRAMLDAERSQKQKSPQCQFWFRQNQEHPTDKTRLEVDRYCQR